MFDWSCPMHSGVAEASEAHRMAITDNHCITDYFMDDVYCLGE